MVPIQRISESPALYAKEPHVTRELRFGHLCCIGTYLSINTHRAVFWDVFKHPVLLVVKKRGEMCDFLQSDNHVSKKPLGVMRFLEKALHTCRNRDNVSRLWPCHDDTTVHVVCALPRLIDQGNGLRRQLGIFWHRQLLTFIHVLGKYIQFLSSFINSHRQLLWCWKAYTFEKPCQCHAQEEQISLAGVAILEV